MVWWETPAGSAPRPAAALDRGVAALIAEQGPDGGWEGEVVWCPMLAAQYVLMCHITGIEIPEERRRRLLLHFRDTRFADGLWGMHAHSEPYLFVTTLVYVAARLLGLGHSDPLLKPAQDWIRREGGVAAIPSWGKFWLAMLGLYDWRGVNPILPEGWTLPRWMPLHPSNFYCHTRLIYMGMAAIYGRGLRAEIGPTVVALRDELYPGGYDKTDFRAARHSLRTGDLYRAPGRASRMLYATSRLIDRFRIHGLRERAVAAITAAIRWELRTTDHTSISPVSGLLNIIALWLADPSDVDFRRAVERFEGWFWEDDRKGARVAGARSASWDTAFALQALAAAAPHADLGEASTRGAAFLAGQQIRRSFAGFADAYRIDPKGGWCFAGVWHGWPVSDCAAEAVSALVAVRGAAVDPGSMEEAVRFILRCQNRDGGFGSYEPRKTRVGLEFLNPAEMFGESMTETSFVECTSSAVAALREARLFCPDPLRDQVDHATGRAARWLRRKQAPDGTWPAAWGVNFIYGVMFGVTGLLAAGAPTYDPAIRKACRWLEARQRRDGGWGEHHASCLTGRYVEHDESQIVQTAWALRTLLAAAHPNWPAIDHGARFLTASQNGDGTWPAQDMAGVFFRTALLDYTLYRSYFPVWALGLYETRRKSRLSLAAATRQAA